MRKWVSYTRVYFSETGIGGIKKSISDQNAEIDTFLRQYGWRVEKRYSDRKQTADAGQKFQALISDGMNRKFDGVAVISMNQCGENVWVAIDVLYKMFYLAGIAFAVVEDGFLSSEKSPQEVETYIRSKRGKEIRRAENRSKQEGTGLTARHEKYGYRLSEDRRTLEIEESGAQIVREIFQMYLDGMEYTQIANYLQERNVMPPQAHMLLIRGKNPQNIAIGRWRGNVIKRILENPVYMGVARSSVEGKTDECPVPSIVSAELFIHVQSLMRERQTTRVESRRESDTIHVLNKRIFDKESNTALHCKRMDRHASERVYVLEGHNVTRSDSRKSRSIRQETVLAVVAAKVREAARQAEEVEARLRTKEGDQCKERELAPLRVQAASLCQEINEIYLQKINLHTAYHSDKLTLERLRLEEEQLERRLAKNEECFQQLMEREQSIRKTFSCANPWVVRYRGACVSEDLTRVQVRQWVRAVTVKDFTTVEVELYDQEWRQRLPKEWLNE